MYAIRQLSSGKVYIGSASRSFSHRWRRHKNELRDGVHHSPILQRAWDKYGEADFVWEIVELCDPEECITREQQWIDATGSCDPCKGFNIAKVAGSNRGSKFSPKARSNMSRAYFASDKRQQHLHKIIQMNRGRKRSIETCRKISEANTGRKCSPEVVERMRNDPRRKVLSDSHRAAVVAANKKRLADPEFYKRFCEARIEKARAKATQSPGTLLTVGEKTKTLAEWASVVGITTASLVVRLKSGMSAEDAVTRQKRPGVPFSDREKKKRSRTAEKNRFLSGKQSRQRCITLNGETLLIVEWAERLGVQSQSIIKRIKEGMSEEEALTKPFVRRAPRRSKLSIEKRMR